MNSSLLQAKISLEDSFMPAKKMAKGSYAKAEKMEPKAMKMAEKKAGMGKYARSEKMESKAQKMMELGILSAPKVRKGKMKK